MRFSVSSRTTVGRVILSLMFVFLAYVSSTYFSWHGEGVNNIVIKVEHETAISASAAAPTVVVPTATEAPTPKIRTTTPGEPRPQFVFLIQYHKTGHDIVFQYRKAVRISGRENSKKGYTYGGEESSPWGISNKIVSHQRFQDSDRRGQIYYLRRSHDNITGCPSMNFPLTTGKETNKTSPSHINLLTMACAPNFFCNLYENDVFLQTVDNGGTPSDGPNHDIKFVHMIRDPFDIAISNYLYHSQDPTPEEWVIESEGKPFNPCVIDHEMLHFAVGDENESSTKLISWEQVDQLEELCHELMYNPKTMEPYQHYFEALRSLPFDDGLKLATMMLLVTKGVAGGEIMRMTSNVFRLNEWQRQNQAERGATNTVLSMMMDQDWTDDNYSQSLDRVTGFLIDDLELSGKDENEGDDDASSGNATSFEDGPRMARDDFIVTVRERALSSRQSLMQGDDYHITRSRLTPEERLELKAKLGANVLLGPILSSFQTIVNSAYGLKK